MSKRQFLMILGLWVVIFLFLGFPSRWDKIFALASGILIILIAARIKPEGSASVSHNATHVEHRSDAARDDAISPSAPQEGATGEGAGRKLNDIIRTTS